MSIAITGGSCHKYHFCRNKFFVVTNMCISRQTRVCHDKTHLSLRQKYAGRDKTFVATKACFVTTNICHEKSFVATKTFVMTKVFGSSCQ